MIYHITPVPKPRMTQRDKWKQRPCVMEYRAFKDKLRFAKLVLPESFCVTFFMPMPASWSQKKKAAMEGKPHKGRPDLDNLTKGLLDFLPEDSHVWRIHGQKVWAYEGAILIEEIQL